MTSQAIVIALGTAGFMVAYHGFKLSESESEIMRAVGSLLVLLSFTFVVGLVWIASQLAENIPIAYLQAGLVPFITGFTWIYIAMIFIWFFRILYIGFKLLTSWLKTLVTLRREKERSGNKGGFRG